MKKILFGSAAALCAAVGFSSYKPAAKFTTYYWFSLIKNVPKAQTPSALKNVDINHSFVTTTTTTPPTGPACSGTTYRCLAAFTAAQLTAAHANLITGAFTAQTAVAAGRTRN
jgi:hypothetical protein